MSVSFSRFLERICRKNFIFMEEDDELKIVLDARQVSAY